MLIQGIKNESVNKTDDPIPPIINPLGPSPVVSTLSPGQAARAAGEASSIQAAEVSVNEGGGFKNILYLGLVGFLVWKFGKGLLK